MSEKYKIKRLEWEVALNGDDGEPERLVAQSMFGPYFIDRFGHGWTVRLIVRHGNGACSEYKIAATVRRAQAEELAQADFDTRISEGLEAVA